MEFGFLESRSLSETIVKEEKKDLGPRGYWHAAAGTKPVLQKIEIEIGTDPVPEELAADTILNVKQENEEELDDIAKAIQEPEIRQAEQIVEVVMGELASEQGGNVQVVKAE